MAQAKLKAQLIIDRINARKVTLEKRRVELKEIFDDRRHTLEEEATGLLVQWQRECEDFIHQLTTREHRFFTGPLSIADAKKKFEREFPDKDHALKNRASFTAEHCRQLSFINRPEGWGTLRSAEDYEYESIFTDLSKLNLILRAAHIAGIYSSEHMILSDEEVTLIFGQEGAF